MTIYGKYFSTCITNEFLRKHCDNRGTNLKNVLSPPSQEDNLFILDHPGIEAIVSAEF